jgi:hypothetical protein
MLSLTAIPATEAFMFASKIHIFLSGLLVIWAETGLAEIKKASIPDVEVNIGINSVLNQKNNVMPKKIIVADNTSVATSPVTNGYTLPGGSIIVDSPVEPKCVFYGNYNEGTGDAFQYFDVNTIVFECQ